MKLIKSYQMKTKELIMTNLGQLLILLAVTTMVLTAMVLGVLISLVSKMPKVLIWEILEISLVISLAGEEEVLLVELKKVET